MSKTRVKFKGVPVNRCFVFHGIKFRKTSDRYPSSMKQVPEHEPNCINLENNHPCVVGGETIVEVW